MTVYELLEELEDLVENSPKMPLTTKPIIDQAEFSELIRNIRLTLPDDVQQAQWLREQKDTILANAKAEYEKIVTEAKKQADYMVAEHEITRRAKEEAEMLMRDADSYVKTLKMGTFEYMDRMLYNMQEKMDELHDKYLGTMFHNLENSFNEIESQLKANRSEVKEMAIAAKEGE